MYINDIKDVRHFTQRCTAVVQKMYGNSLIALNKIKTPTLQKSNKINCILKFAAYSLLPQLTLIKYLKQTQYIVLNFTLDKKIKSLDLAKIVRINSTR